MKTTLMAFTLSIFAINGAFAAPGAVSTQAYVATCSYPPNEKWCLGYAQAVIDMERHHSDRYPDCDISTFDLIETVRQNPTSETRAHQAIVNAWTATCK